MAGFVKIHILRLGPNYSYHYFPEDFDYAVLFKDTASINNWNIIKLVSAVFETRTILPLAPGEGPQLLELECSHSPNTELGRNSWVRNVNEIRPTVQLVVRRTSVDTDKHMTLQKPNVAIPDNEEVWILQNYKIDFFTIIRFVIWSRYEENVKDRKDIKKEDRERENILSHEIQGIFMGLESISPH
jgi:hypothetical protein